MYIKDLLCITVQTFALVSSVAAVSLPMICKLDDSECITRAAQAFVPIFAQGIPEIGMETLEPLSIKKVNASHGTLKFIVTDLTFTGFKDAIIKRIRFDPTKRIMSFKIQVTLNLEANYEMSGNLLFLPVEGKGPLHAKLRKMEILLEEQIKEETLADGKIHWHAVEISHSFRLIDESEVLFENLFERNQFLATATREFISANSNEIITELASPIVKSVLDNMIYRNNVLYQAIPLDELHIK